MEVGEVVYGFVVEKWVEGVLVDVSPHSGAEPGSGVEDPALVVACPGADPGPGDGYLAGEHCHHVGSAIVEGGMEVVVDSLAYVNRHWADGRHVVEKPP